MHKCEKFGLVPVIHTIYKFTHDVIPSSSLFSPSLVSYDGAL